jgi:hypothetical protein
MIRADMIALSMSAAGGPPEGSDMPGKRKDKAPPPPEVIEGGESGDEHDFTELMQKMDSVMADIGQIDEPGLLGGPNFTISDLEMLMSSTAEGPRKEYLAMALNFFKRHEKDIK